MFLVLTISPGHEDEVRDMLADVSGLVRSVGFRSPNGGLCCIVGLGSQLWDRLFGAPRPAGLHPFMELNGPRHTAVATPGDLLFHLRAHRFDLCFELAERLMDRLRPFAQVVDEVHGFKFFDERDLLGFVDGTENPVGVAATAAALIGEEDPTFVNGSYVIVQKYVHDLESWDALSVEEQERAIGRSKLEDIEMADDVKPPNSHVALNTIIDESGEQHQILRFNMPFGTRGGSRVRDLLHRLCPHPRRHRANVGQHVHWQPAWKYRSDPRLLDAPLGQLVLRTKRGLPGRPAGTGGELVQHGGATAGPGARRRVAWDWQLERSYAVNHLLRTHAPITEAAWKLLDDEARQRSLPALAARKLVDFSGPHGWEYSATNLGHVKSLGTGPGDGVLGFQRQVLPIVEVRADFELSRDQLRDADRGADDTDLGPLDRAAHQIAIAENVAVFHGWQDVVTGIDEASPYEPARLGEATVATRARWRTPSIRSSATALAGRMGSPSDGTSTAGWSKRPSTGATPCSSTCARSSMGRSCGPREWMAPSS